MLRQIKLLSALELKNVFGINEILHTKDKTKKRNAILVGIVWCVLIAMVFVYVGGLTWGLATLGLSGIVGAYLTMIASFVILAFGIFKAGGVIFSRGAYDILASLPVSQTAIAVSRFVRMYVEDLLLTLAVLLPGGAVYAFLTRPGIWFYLIWPVSALLIPLIPLSAATLFGTLVTAVSSRMKNKAVVESVLSVGLVLVFLCGTMGMSTDVASGEITLEMIAGLADMVRELLSSFYPPAMWLGDAMVGQGVGGLLLYAAVSLAVFSAVILVTARNFHGICRRLNVTSAKHDYRMEKLSASSAIGSLYRRELKRYFSSGTYVTNTILGPIMGAAMAVAVFFLGADGLSEMMGLPIDISPVVPFVVGAAFGMMPATAVTISMEGKQWWITKSLPLTTKQVLDAKLLMVLSLMLPFYVLAEVLLLLAMRPVGLDILWVILIPGVTAVFSCVFALTVNLLLPRFEWDSDVYIVKQSASAGIGGLGGMLVVVIGAVAASLVPGHLTRAAYCLLLGAVTALLYLRNSRLDLKKL